MVIWLGRGYVKQQGQQPPRTPDKVSEQVCLTSTEPDSTAGPWGLVVGVGLRGGLMAPERSQRWGSP